MRPAVLLVCIASTVLLGCGLVDARPQDAGAEDALADTGQPVDAGPSEDGGQDAGSYVDAPSDAPTKTCAVGVAAGNAWSCARSVNDVWCWGDNGFGELGDGTFVGKTVPTPISIANVTQLALGGFHSCARKTDGSLWCWGADEYGALGDGKSGPNTFQTSPIPVVALGTDVVSVSTGSATTCAVKTDATLWCWGANASGQVGDGSTTLRTTPVQVNIAPPVVEVSAGNNHGARSRRPCERTSRVSVAVAFSLCALTLLGRLSIDATADGVRGPST